MSTFVFANNVKTTLSAVTPSTSVYLTLASSQNLPALQTGQMMPVTLNDAATGQVYEICYAIAISGTTLTVVRGQEGTGAQSWSVGDYVFVGPTAGTLAPVNGNPATSFVAAYSTSSTQQVIPRSQGDLLYAALSSFGGNIPTDNWVSFPNGLILQVGSITLPNSGTTSSVTSITFPLAFPTLCSGVWGIANGDANSTYGFPPVIKTWNYAKNTCSVQGDILDGGTNGVKFNQTVPVSWVAIGA